MRFVSNLIKIWESIEAVAISKISYFASINSSLRHFLIDFIKHSADSELY